MKPLPTDPIPMWRVYLVDPGDDTGRTLLCRDPVFAATDVAAVRALELRADPSGDYVLYPDASLVECELVTTSQATITFPKEHR